MAVLSLPDLCQRYVDLLASQYQQPKAQRQIALWAKQFLADNFIQSVQAAYPLGTSVGVQLDVLGKYIGVSRYQGLPALPPFFGFLPGATPGGYPSAFPYTEANYLGTWNPATNTPTLTNPGTNGEWYAVQVAGTSTSPISASFNQGDLIKSNGTTWVKDATFNNNGFNSPADLAQNFGAVFDSPFYASQPLIALTDPAYTQLLYLQIVRNASNGTLPDIISRLQSYFGAGISLVDNLNMTVTYTVHQAVVILPSNVLTAFLPCPAGVGLTVNQVNP